MNISDEQNLEVTKEWMDKIQKGFTNKIFPFFRRFYCVCGKRVWYSDGYIIRLNRDLQRCCIYDHEIKLFYIWNMIYFDYRMSKYNLLRLPFYCNYDMYYLICDQNCPKIKTAIEKHKENLKKIEDEKNRKI